MMAAARQLRSGPEPVRVFGTAEVARILGITPHRVRAMARLGVCRPQRRGRGLEFSFQDLVLLRAAHSLLQARVPARRLRQALAELAHQLPADRPLSGVRVYADGKQVVARDRRAVWRPESGQIVFSFAVDKLARQARALTPGTTRPARPLGPRRPAADSAWRWFERALALEEANDRPAACTAYRRALELDPDLADAYINLGRLVHEDGDATEAVQLYHLAVERAPDDAVAHYNLALAFEDVRKPAAAVAHYRRALACDPTFADAHFNLARLLDRLGRRHQALVHLLSYKKLSQ